MMNKGLLTESESNAPIYLCEAPEGPVGWTRTAEEAVEWAMNLRDMPLIRIIKLYEIKGGRNT